MRIPLFLLSAQVRGLTDRPQGGGQGQDRTVDLLLQLDASWTWTCVALVLAAAAPVRRRARTPDPALSTGTRARPRLSTPAIFHPMPTAARRPAADGYPLACQPSRSPSARPGMTHRDEQNMRQRIKSTHIADLHSRALRCKRHVRRPYHPLSRTAHTPLPFTSGTSVPVCPVFSVALRVSHDCGRRSGAAVNATRPLL